MWLSFVGELGWELHVPRSACVPVYQAVMTAGTKHGLVNAGYRAIDSLSIEKGMCRSHTVPRAMLQAGQLPPPALLSSPSLPPLYPFVSSSPADTPNTLPALPMNQVCLTVLGMARGVSGTCAWRARGAGAYPALWS